MAIDLIPIVCEKAKCTSRREDRHLCLCTGHFSLGCQGFSRARGETRGRPVCLAAEVGGGARACTLLAEMGLAT